MRRMITAAVAACMTGVSALAAQPAGAPQGGAMAGPLSNPAEFLLARTGELQLTDAQVTRLAGIARRSAERRRAVRASLDSMRPAGGRAAPPDSAARQQLQQQLRQRAEQMRPAMERLREQSLADRRDAIAVLTPDQQARAWEQVAASGRSMRGQRGRPGGMRGMGMRRGEMRGGMGVPRGGPRRLGPPAGGDGERRPAAAGRRRPADDR